MRLPILGVAKEAYAFVWDRKGAFWALAMPGIAVIALFYALLAWMIWFKAGKPEKLADYVLPGETGFDTADPLFLVVWAASVIAYVVILVMYSVAWHRLYLLPGASSSPRLAYRWHGRQTKFLLNYVKIFLILIPLWLIVIGTAAILVGVSKTAGGGDNIGPFGMAIAAAVVAAALALGWIWARLSLLFPATAADAHMTVAEGWRFTAGNGWRLFWIVVVVAVPVGIVSSFVDTASQALGFATGAAGTLTGNLALALAQQFVAFVGVAVGVSALSVAYKRIRDGGPAAPGAQAQGQPLPPNG